MATPGASAPDWLAFSRRAANAGREALKRFPLTAQRAEKLGRGEGGDMTLAIDGAVEDTVFAELEGLGIGLCAISEERGLVEIAGGGPIHVVIDPIIRRRCARVPAMASAPIETSQGCADSTPRISSGVSGAAASSRSPSR